MINLYSLSTLSVQGTKRSERLNLQFCCVTFNRRTSSTPHSSALQNCKFSSFWLSDLCHRNFAHFQGRRKRRTGRTPTEDNAENGQNYMAEAFGPLYTEGSFSLWKKSGYLWEAWAGHYPDKAVLLGRRRGNTLEAGNGLKRKAIRERSREEGDSHIAFFISLLPLCWLQDDQNYSDTDRLG